MNRLLLLLLLLAISAAVQAAERPNILWITSEDNSISWLSCYGSENTHTPQIDRLAAEGFRYTNCYDNGAVCAPTRSSWLTGMHAISTGTQEMRSSRRVPEQVAFYNKQLKQAGYYTANCRKTDYNLSGENPQQYWDFSGSDYRNGWRNRDEGQPFFTVLNLSDSHESRAFGDLRKDSKDPAAMKLHGYHPDIPEMRETYAIYAGAVEKMDAAVGKAIDALKKEGLYEDTIVVYNSDHGGVLPRSKRFLYASGIHCPLIVRIPEKWKHWWPGEAPGTTVDRLVSFIDMPKTWVSLAGGEVPDVYQGRIFLGDAVEPEPTHHLAWRGRADQCLDCVRVIRDKRYAYHKNYAPFAPAGQYLPYMHNMKATGAWEQYHKAGKTNAITGRFFEPRVSEEFYDNAQDFDNIHNLIDAPQHQETIAKLKAELRRQQLACFDSGLLPEGLRDRRAEAHGLTNFEMVRDPEIYPLARYLDAADLALARSKDNLMMLATNLANADEGIQYWAVVGLLLLNEEAAPVIPELRRLFDRAAAAKIPYLSHFSAWAIYRAGDRSQGEALLQKLFEENPEDGKLANVFSWMGDEAKPFLTRISKGKLVTGSYPQNVIRRAGVELIRAESATPIPADCFVTDAGQPGLTAHYFNSPDLEGKPAFTRVDKAIHANWKKKAPASLPEAGFSVAWTGALKPKESGTHVLAVDFRNGGKVWLDGQMVLNSWAGQTAALVRLKAGTAHTLKVVFVKNRKDGRAVLKWRLPSQIPESLR